MFSRQDGGEAAWEAGTTVAKCLRKGRAFQKGAADHAAGTCRGLAGADSLVAYLEFMSAWI